MWEVFGLSQACESKDAPRVSIEYSKLLKYISDELTDSQLQDGVDRLITILKNVQECDVLLKEIEIVYTESTLWVDAKSMLKTQLEQLKVKITTRRIQLSQN